MKEQIDIIIQYFQQHNHMMDLASAIGIALMGVIAMWGVNYTACRFIRRWLANLNPEYTERLIKALTGPLKLLVLSYFLLWSFDQIRAMPSTLWQRVHHDLFPVLTGLTVLVFAFRVVDIIAYVLRVRWSTESTNLDERWADLFGKVGKSIVVVIGGLIILQDLGWNVIPFLTGASFLGAAVALASQSTIANAIGSLEIMADRLFKEGDRISFGEYDGFVSKMGLRSISLVSMTGEKINLPNKDLVDKQIRNYSRGKWVRNIARVGIAYDHGRGDIEKAMRILNEILEAHPKIDKHNVYFKEFGDSTLNLEAVYWADYKTAPEYNEIVTALNMEIKERFDAEKLVFAFPTRTIYVKKDE